MSWRRIRAIAVTAVVAVSAATIAMVGVRPAISATTAAVRIMPLGDSITGSPGCWRALLWNKLKDNGFTNIDFVGTQPPQGCAVPYDGDGEGHGGALVTNVADQDQLPAWLAASKPDIVLMHFGTNDVWSNRSTETILSAYSTLVDQMRASNASMRILVAQILPVAPSSCTECPARTIALNKAIPAWAAAKTTARSPITVVDQWTGWDPATDTGDGVHPNDTGIVKMANRWYPPLAAALSGTTGPSSQASAPASSAPASSIPASPSSIQASSVAASSVPASSVPASSFPASSVPASSAPAPSSGCTATYRITNQWSGGFQAEVSVKNTGTSTIAGWSTGFAFGGGQQISQAWGASVTQSATAVTAKNLPWNGAVGAGSSTAFGFIASWNGSGNPTPALTCTVS